jgi:hypothetical protein
MFTTMPSTVPDFVLDAWINEATIARVLGRTKPKGTGDRPVCNMQGTVLTVLDKICAAVLTACTRDIDEHVREVQRQMSVAFKTEVSMLWTIDSVHKFVDAVPRYAPDVDKNKNAPTYVFTDVSGCYNHIPQGYETPDCSNIDDLCDAASRHQIATIEPANGDSTLVQLCPREGLPQGAAGALSHLMDGWSAEVFTNRSGIDLRCYHQAVVTKACHLQTQRPDAVCRDTAQQVLHLRLTESKVVCMGWTHVAAVAKLSAKQRSSSMFLTCLLMQRMLATLIILQVLRGGNAVFRSLLGVFQGSYSGGIHADGILKLCEIGYIVSLLTDRDRRWLLPYFSSSMRYVDDSSFGLNPYAPWQLKCIYPVRGLDFTIDTCTVGSGTSEYMGIHISIDQYWHSWCLVTLQHYDKKRCITRKYGLDFDVKCPFKALERPTLSSIGIVYGDLHRISQACSTFAIFKASLHKRIQHWIDDFMMPVSFVSNTILRWWTKHSLGVMVRYGWEPQSLHESATVAAFKMHLRDIFSDSLLSRGTKRIECDALDDGSLRCTRQHQLSYSLASDARGKGKCDGCGQQVATDDSIGYCVMVSEQHESLDCNFYLCEECVHEARRRKLHRQRNPCCCCCTCRQVNAADNALYDAAMTLCSETPCT